MEPEPDPRDEEAPPASAPSAVPYVRARRVLEGPWDAVVVGAGVGGLVAAALLAKRGGLRVLVLERHYELGGLTQTFKRRRHVFEVGVHYVGDVGHGAPARRVFDEVTGGRLRWASLPSVYDRVRLGGVEVGLGGGPGGVRCALTAYSPREGAVVDRYLEDLWACARASPSFLMARAAGLHDERAPFYRWADVPTAEHVGRLGASPRLSALMTAHFGNYASPPWQSSFAAHAIATAHYFHGAFHPVGGGGRIAREMARTITERGGAVIVRAEVERILVEDDRACGVRLIDGRELRAPIVVSDAGAALTFGRLLDDDAPEVGPLREAVQAVGPSRAHVALYVGLRGSPRELGLSGANLWVIPPEPVRDDSDVLAWIRGERSEMPGLFTSFPCANDPSWDARMPGRSSIIVSMLFPFAPFERWEDTTRGRRGAEYDALKARLAKDALATVVRHVPALEGAVEHVEMSSPLTTRHFAAHPSGETCGLDHSPARFRRGPRAATPIAGLYLTGQDAWICGVSGAACGGVVSASAALRRDLFREILFGA